MNNPAIQQFIEQVMTIQDGTIGAGGVKMAPMGTTSAVFGAVAASDEVVIKLRKAAAALATELSGSGPMPETVDKIVTDIESSLLTLQTLSVITEAQAEKLIDDVHDLTADYMPKAS